MGRRLTSYLHRWAKRVGLLFIGEGRGRDWSSASIRQSCRFWDCGSVSEPGLSATAENNIRLLLNPRPRTSIPWRRHSATGAHATLAAMNLGTGGWKFNFSEPRRLSAQKSSPGSAFDAAAFIKQEAAIHRGS